LAFGAVTDYESETRWLSWRMRVRSGVRPISALMDDTVRVRKSVELPGGGCGGSSWAL
jgi:hypothetical protein